MSRRDSPDRDRGQATVEFALVLPIVAVTLVLVVQLVVVLTDRIRLAHAIRDATRAAAVSDEPERAARGAMRRHFPDVIVDVAFDGDLVTVTAWVDSVTDLPVVGSLLPDVTLRDRLTMMHETAD